jgi:hypothetical protein
MSHLEENKGSLAAIWEHRRNGSDDWNAVNEYIAENFVVHV